MKQRLTSMQQHIAHSCPVVPCNCDTFRRQAPHLFSASQSHLLIRYPHQWSSILPPELVPVVTQNARNTTLPSDEFIDDSVDRLMDSLSLDCALFLMIVPPYLMERRFNLKSKTIVGPS